MDSFPSAPVSTDSAAYETTAPAEASAPPLGAAEVAITRLQPWPFDTRAVPEDRLAQLIESVDADPAFLRHRPVGAMLDGTVYAGWQRVRAAQALGWTTVPAVLEDIPLQLAQERHLRDNNHAGHFRPAAVGALLQELEAVGSDLDLLGFEPRELQQFLDAGAPAPLADAADLPVPAEPETGLGDRWDLDAHSVWCGDARSGADLWRLFDGREAHLLATDPPYGVGYRGKTAAQLTIANDEAHDLAALLRDAFAAIDPILAPGAAIYIAHPAGPLSGTFLAAFQAQGWELRQTLVWVKDQFVLGHADYHYQHEPILFGYRPGGGRRGRGAAGWYGDDAQPSVFAIPRPQASPDHPTTKPVELIATWIRNSSRSGEIVCDPFLGSGTTLLAAEQTGRTCLGIELEPRYVDVAVKRWEAATGRRAIRHAASADGANP